MSFSIMNFCCINLGSFFRREPDPPPSSEWDQCISLARKGPLVVAPNIAGHRGPLLITQAWMEKHMPEEKWERDPAGQALLALAGKVDVSDIREYPSHPRGEVTLRASGDVVTYRYTKDGYRELPPGAVASISVATKGGREITMGCWTRDNDGFASLQSDADTAAWAKTELCGFRLNASHDDHARAGDIWEWRA